MSAIAIKTIELEKPDGYFGGLILPPAFRKRASETRFRQEWTLSRFLYECLQLGWDGEGDPKRWYAQAMQKLRKYQRGSFSMFPAGSTAIAGSGGSVVLTSHFVTDSNPSTGNASTSAQFRNSGELYFSRLNLADQSITGEWWSDHPATPIGDDYAVRALSGGSGSWTSAAAADNTWTTMTVTRTWTKTQSGVGSSSASRTFEVGPEPSGPADDSAVITCAASVGI